MYNRRRSHKKTQGGAKVARRTKEEALETRERLLESALDVMSERPFSEVSMNEIAHRVGLSKGAIYWHFKNKNDILIHLIGATYEREAKALGLDSAGAFGSIREYFRNKMQKPLENERFGKMFKLMLRQIEWPKEVQESVLSLLRDRFERERKRIEDILARAKEEGKIRADVSPEEISFLILAIFHGLFLQQLTDLHVNGVLRVDFSKYTNFILDAFEKELGPGARKAESTEIAEREGASHDDIAGA